MIEEILKLIDACWKFDEAQQPMSSWHDKQDLLIAIEQLKNCNLQNVSQQRELLLAFVEYYNKQEPYEYVPISVIERFLKANNCG